MEHQLGQWSSSQFKEAVNNKTTEMANPFQVKATKIQGKIFFSYFPFFARSATKDYHLLVLEQAYISWNLSFIKCMTKIGMWLK